ncbi:MAG: sarcosine oxidase subunit delta [Gammaproteobacteria bacterium]|nr:sarcosine oxidase subunit delta [Gammaproteobacteria bacterium]MDH4254006.1 sarcosine oxidase subunit delta [Gammaproteobacteria bacterium]MDH5311134.1 sarcosine oxidase subunit delta [Gammaproteobacteria bacterium]
MIRLRCPHCGLRDHSEFTFLGDATVSRPGTEAAGDLARGGAWSDYLYLRRNPRGVQEEFWHHGRGCRAWLVVTRNTETHEVLDTRLARDRGDRA